MTTAEGIPATGSTSLSLIQRVQMGDADAWARFSQIYGPLVYEWCRRFGLQASDAADVTQDVFRSVSSSIGGYRRSNAGDSFRGWLWTVTRNRFVDHVRREEQQQQASGGTEALRRIQELPIEPPAASDESASVDSSQIKRRALEIIRREFDKRNWQAFWRSAVEGEAPSQIAEDLGVTVSAVHKARQRILLRLREELADFLDE